MNCNNFCGILPFFVHCEPFQEVEGVKKLKLFYSSLIQCTALHKNFDGIFFLVWRSNSKPVLWYTFRRHRIVVMRAQWSDSEPKRKWNLVYQMGLVFFLLSTGREASFFFISDFTTTASKTVRNFEAPLLRIYLVNVA